MRRNLSEERTREERMVEAIIEVAWL